MAKDKKQNNTRAENDISVGLFSMGNKYIPCKIYKQGKVDDRIAILQLATSRSKK